MDKKKLVIGVIGANLHAVGISISSACIDIPDLR